jgi:hypothetical protein
MELLSPEPEATHLLKRITAPDAILEPNEGE